MCSDTSLLLSNSAPRFYSALYVPEGGGIQEVL